MSIKTKIVLSVVAVLIILNISSPAQEFYNSVKPLTTASNTLNYKLTGDQYHFLPTIMGSVYLNNDWSDCKIKLENGDVYEHIYVRLNTLLDELIAYNDRIGSVFVLDKSIVDEFELEKGYLSYNIFRKVNFERIPKGEHYMNVLYDGDVKLYIFHQTGVVKTSVYKDVIHGGLRDSEYKQALSYYIVFSDNSMQKVLRKRRSFLQLFPEQKKVLKRLFRKNKVRFLSDEDMIKAAQIIEQEIL